MPLVGERLVQRATLELDETARDRQIGLEAIFLSMQNMQKRQRSAVDCAFDYEIWCLGREIFIRNRTFPHLEISLI